MDNFKIIYKILSVLEKSMDLENVDIERISSKNLGISQQRWNKYMEMLLDAGYIKGVSIKKYTDGEMRVDIENIRITLKGLEYLSENSIMQRMYNVTKGITDLIPWYHPFLIEWVVFLYPSLREERWKVMMKAMLSQPMAGKTDEEIIVTREKAIKAL